MQLQHVVEAQQFDADWLTELFARADEVRALQRHGLSEEFRGKVMATLFYEPSTRTRLSFESAMMRLGGGIITTESAEEFSSAVKGETLEDTIRVIGDYADVIVLRHHEEGASKKAAAIASVPIINAGDGTGQHPTQTFLDAYTISRELGIKRLESLSIALVGDLKNGRTVRSLCYILPRLGNPRIFLVSPKALAMRDDIKEYLIRHGAAFEECEDLAQVAGKVDVIYMTRLQKERLHGLDIALDGKFKMSAATLARMRSDAIIMHPLPRVDEIQDKGAVDADPRAAYFRQSGNGLYVRMALLQMILGSPQRG